MDKNKINIDQFFKNPLQNFEGNADDALFEGIKKKLDINTIPVDDYFKAALAGWEADVENLPFDAIQDQLDSMGKSKISVDDFFKAGMLGVSSDAEGLFEGIKDKLSKIQALQTPKISVGQYFKESLLDFNANALLVPFSEIKDKIAPEGTIDGHFKDALQNYEGIAREGEFALIREQVLKIQARASRRRIALIVLALLIPAFFVIQKYMINSTGIGSGSTATTQKISESNANTNNSSVTNSSKGISSDPAVKSEMGSGKSGKASVNPASSGNQNEHAANKINAGNKGAHDRALKNTAVKDQPANHQEENNIAEGKDASKGNVEKAVSNNPDGKTDKTGNEADKSATEPKDQDAIAQTKKGEEKNPNKINLHKPAKKFTLEFSVAMAYNNRYLHTRDSASNYLNTRNDADKGTYKNNFGIDLMKQMGRLSIGFGLHENQFGQRGIYQITANLSDSIPVFGPPPNYILKGYFHYNFRDTSFVYSYNNSFTSIELPFHVTYKILSASKWNYEIGTGVLLSYIAGAQGALPNASADGIIQLKNNLNILNRFGSAIDITQKLNYNISNHWQMGTELYLKTNITSIYKRSTGVSELPYSFGLRWGIGYKF